MRSPVQGMNRSRIRTVLAGAAACLCLLVQGAAQGQESLLWVGGWRLATWGFHGDGICAWVSGPLGLRLDVAAAAVGADPAASAGRLWEQTGEGWTFVCGAVDGTFGPWSEPWRPLAPGPRRALAELAAAVAAATTGTGTETSRLALRWNDPPAGMSAFHAALAARAAGSGDAVETVILEAGSSPRAVRLRSSRRPGRLELWPAAGYPGAVTAPAEVFAPLWPLATFFPVPEIFREPRGASGIENNAVLHGGRVPGEGS